MTKQKETDVYREQTSGYQEEREGRRGEIGLGDQEVQTTMHKTNTQ